MRKLFFVFLLLSSITSLTLYLPIPSLSWAEDIQADYGVFKKLFLERDGKRLELDPTITADIFDSSSEGATCTSRKAVSGQLVYCDANGVLQMASGGVRDPYCGDNLINQAAGIEQCDGTARIPGEETSCTRCGTPGSTRECLCTYASSCANAVVETSPIYSPSEVCSPGGVMGATGCLSTQLCAADCSGCSTPTPPCGDNIVGTGELCDPPYTADECSGQTCAGDCKSCQDCGDGVLEGVEICDPGDIWIGGDGQPPPVGPCGSRCLADCTCPDPTCGDGIVESPETCDPPGPTCSSTCRNICSCGNSLVETGCSTGFDETCEYTTSTAIFGSAWQSGTGTAVKWGTGGDTDLAFAANERFTIFAKVCPMNIGAAAYQMIMYTGAAAADNKGWVLQLNRDSAGSTTGDWAFSVCPGTSTCTVESDESSPGVVTTGTCYDIAVTRNATTGLTFRWRPIGGAWTSASFTVSAAAINPSKPFSIGGNDAGEYSFNGVIDDVQVWTGCDMTEAELSAYADGPLWCSSCGAVCGSTTFVGTNGTCALEAYVPFENAAEECTASIGSAPYLGTSIGSGASYTTAYTWGVGSAETVSPPCDANFACSRTTCVCEPTTAGATCGNGVIEAGESCDAAGATKTCGACVDQNTSTCCTSCVCSDDPGVDLPRTSALLNITYGNDLGACPPGNDTCTDGPYEACTSCNPATFPNPTTYNFDRISLWSSETNYSYPGLRYVGTLAPAASLLSKYVNFGSIHHAGDYNFGDVELRQRFTKGFKACSGDWSYDCGAGTKRPTSADCAAITAGWTCDTIAPNTDVFLRAEGSVYAAWDLWERATCTYDGNDVFVCTAANAELVPDHANEHYIKVLVAHIRHVTRETWCTGCTGPGESAPSCSTDAQCVAAGCGAGSTCEPVPLSAIFFDNIHDATYKLDGGGLVPTRTGQRLIDPRAGATLALTCTPAACNAFPAHDSDGFLSRAEYNADQRYGLANVSQQLRDAGITVTLNLAGQGPISLAQSSAYRALLDDYSKTARVPIAMIESYGSAGNNSCCAPVETAVPTTVHDPSFEEALDAARWLTGKAASPYTAPTNEIGLMGGWAQGISGPRSRELNVAMVLLARGLSTNDYGRLVFPYQIAVDSWVKSTQYLRDWLSSPDLGVRLLGEPAGEWVCETGNFTLGTCTDTGTLPMTGLPNCCVYRRTFPNGAVFVNAKVTTGCAVADFNAPSVSLTGGNWVYGDTSACGATDFAFPLNAANGLLNSPSQICLLTGNNAAGNRISGVGGLSLTLRPGNAAIVYKGACP